MRLLETKDRKVKIALSSAVLVFLSACGATPKPKGAAPADNHSEDELFARGNGAPSGSHCNLNITCVSKSKSTDITGNSGHRIFVPLRGKTKIMLAEGDFKVLDANGTDGFAKFQLPNPDPENDGIATYSVFARTLGKPSGSSATTTWATDASTGDDYCSTESMVKIRKKGESSFTNVSNELLYV